jgi:alanine racemase
MAVVKADGYGHGLERVARALHGADAFGVAALSDAERLRNAGHTQRIVLLSGIDEASDLAELRRLDVETVLHHDSQLALLIEEGAAAPLRVWLKFDTGMHRLGFDPQRAPELHAQLSSLPNVDSDIVLMTHLARSDEFDDASTARQIERFQQFTTALSGARSLSNSAAVLGWPDAHADWVRPGGALYGLSPVAGKSGADLGLEPAMTLSTRLIAINRVQRGEAVGYGGSFVCPRDMSIGIAAIGYGDGYPRHARAATPVLVNGLRAPIVGRVSMDLLAVDLDAMPQARVGDPVTLWGPALPIEEIATAAGTIGYELACGITRRVRFVEA